LMSVQPTPSNQASKIITRVSDSHLPRRVV